MIIFIVVLIALALPATLTQGGAQIGFTVTALLWVISGWTYVLCTVQPTRKRIARLALHLEKEDQRIAEKAQVTSTTDALKCIDYFERTNLLTELYGEISNLLNIRTVIRAIHTGEAFLTDSARDKAIDGLENSLKIARELERKIEQAFSAVNSFDNRAAGIIVRAKQPNLNKGNKDVDAQIAAEELILDNHSSSQLRLHNGILKDIPAMIITIERALEELKGSKAISNESLYAIDVAFLGEKEVERRKIGSLFIKVKYNILTD